MHDFCVISAGLFHIIITSVEGEVNYTVTTVPDMEVVTLRNIDSKGNTSMFGTYDIITHSTDYNGVSF